MNLYLSGIALAERDGTRAETTFRLSPKRTSPFKSVGASVQSTAGSRGVRISFCNAAYTIFGDGVRVLATHSIRQFPLHFPSCASQCATSPNELYVPIPVAARSKAWVFGRSSAETVGSNPTGGMDVCRVLSGRVLCDELTTRPEESHRLWCVAVCDLETSSMRSQTSINCD